MQCYPPGGAHANGRNTPRSVREMNEAAVFCDANILIGLAVGGLPEAMFRMNQAHIRCPNDRELAWRKPNVGFSYIVPIPAKGR
jgi:hypothetical protein